jgi:hypothetical protein
MPSPEPRGSREGVITSRQRLSYKSRSKEKTQLSRKSREETQVESWSQREPERSLSESQETQCESGKRRKTHLSLVSQRRLSRVLRSRGRGQKARRARTKAGGQSLGVGEYM